MKFEPEEQLKMVEESYGWKTYEPLELKDGKKIFISEHKSMGFSITVKDKYDREVHLEDYCLSMKWSDRKSKFIQTDDIKWDKVLETDVNSSFFEYSFDEELMEEGKWQLNEIAVLYGPPKKEKNTEDV